MSKYNIYEFQQFFKSKQDLSKDYLIEKYFKNNKEIENLQSQLQSYKQKEDKLREYMLENTYENEYNITLCKYANDLLEPILQILNEGENRDIRS